jgi:hypothetical protein
MRGLSTLSGCWWAYGFTFTSLLQQTLPQICESLLKYNLMQVCKPCHYTAVEPFQLHPMSMSNIYKVFECLLRLWMGIWLPLTPLPPQMLPQIWESWLKSYLMQVCKPCHYALIQAVEPFKLHPMSMAYLVEVFEHFLRLWMGTWLHTLTVTTTDASPDLGKLSEILPDASVQTMPLRFDLGCRTFQTDPCPGHTYMRYFECLLKLWMGIWLHTHTDTTTDASPD